MSTTRDVKKSEVRAGQSRTFGSSTGDVELFPPAEGLRNVGDAGGIFERLAGRRELSPSERALPMNPSSFPASCHACRKTFVAESCSSDSLDLAVVSAASVNLLTTYLSLFTSGFEGAIETRGRITARARMPTAFSAVRRSHALPCGPSMRAAFTAALAASHYIAAKREPGRRVRAL